MEINVGSKSRIVAFAMYPLGEGSISEGQPLPLKGLEGREMKRRQVREPKLALRVSASKFSWANSCLHNSVG